jgi:hypothetical protein
MPRAAEQSAAILLITASIVDDYALMSHMSWLFATAAGSSPGLRRARVPAITSQ